MTALLTPEEMARADALTIAGGTPGITLMERAGLAVADAVARRPYHTRVAILCGPGNNGGDGFVAARILRQRGFRVVLGLLGARESLKGDAARAAARWTDPVLDAHAVDLAQADLIVDALFGAGLDPDLQGDARALVERMAASGLPIVAVDLPSGLDGRTGQVRGAAAAAVETITFFRRKPGHLLLPGRLLCGRVRVADIGIADGVCDAIRPLASENRPESWLSDIPVPAQDGHKYKRGHALVVSGEAWTAGAARLAARACLRAGAGLVTVATPPDALFIHAQSYAALMARPAQAPEEVAALLADPRYSALVLGPGLGVGPRTRTLVEVCAAHRRSLVLDADAITSFAGDVPTLAGILKAGGPRVLTPHAGEFARLFAGRDDVLTPASKLDRARAAAAALDAVLVLKGPDTIVAASDGRASIADNAPPYLATAGAGDVLAGFICGLLAQGMPAFEAASAAVWLHGEAAREVGPGLIADDLPEALPAVYGRLLVQPA